VNCHDAERLLNPYLDGELDIPSLLEVERHLDECATCERKYRDLVRLGEEIAAARLAYRPPPELAGRIQRARGNAARPPRRWWRAAGLVWAAAAALAFVLLLPRLPIGRSVEDGEVVDAHLRSLLPGRLVDVANSDRHTVKPWFQGKIDFSPNVPDLSAEGFVLAGGRVDVVRRSRGAALVYRRREHVINVFVAEGAGARDRAWQSGGYNVVRWSSGPLTYWAVSDLNAGELGEFAGLMRGR
jgi:anti-sigma factor RsiW